MLPQEQQREMVQTEEMDEFQIVRATAAQEELGKVNIPYLSQGIIQHPGQIQEIPDRMEWMDTVLLVVTVALAEIGAAAAADAGPVILMIVLIPGEKAYRLF